MVQVFALAHFNSSITLPPCIAFITIKLIYLELFGTLSFVIWNLYYILKDMLDFIYYLNTEILKNIFKNFCVVMIGNKYESRFVIFIPKSFLPLN